MIPSGDIRTRAMVALWIETGSGNGLDIGPFESDLTITGIEAAGKYKEPITVSDRDTYIGAILGADKFPEWNLTIKHKGKLGDAAQRTIADLLAYQGSFSADSYTDPLGKVPTHKAIIRINAIGCGVDVFTAPNCKIGVDYSSGDTNTLALKAVCWRPLGTGDPDDVNNQPLVRS